MPERFVKMAGGGNDFLLFEADGRSLSDEERRRIARLCRRGLSVGADGALFLSGGQDGRVHLDYYNADGGLASFCANGTRCAARYAVTRRLAPDQELELETGWGNIGARVSGEAVTLALPDVLVPDQPILLDPQKPDRYATAGLPAKGMPIHVGVPHLVIFVRDDLATYLIEVKSSRSAAIRSCARGPTSTSSGSRDRSGSRCGRGSAGSRPRRCPAAPASSGRPSWPRCEGTPSCRSPAGRRAAWIWSWARGRRGPSSRRSGSWGTRGRSSAGS